MVKRWYLISRSFSKHFLFVCKKKTKIFQIDVYPTIGKRVGEEEKRSLFAFQSILSNSSRFFSHFSPAIKRGARYVGIVFADDSKAWLAWHDIRSRGGFLFICAQLIRTNPRPTVWFTGPAVSEHRSKWVERRSASLFESEYIVEIRVIRLIFFFFFSLFFRSIKLTGLPYSVIDYKLRGI